MRATEDAFALLPRVALFDTDGELRRGALALIITAAHGHVALRSAPSSEGNTLAGLSYMARPQP